MPAFVKQFFVACLPELLPADWCQLPTLAIVIDTLRFTSTVCVALKSGADRIYAVSNVEAARELATKLGPHTRLCGERHCHPIKGFDFGNSPLEYTPERVAGKSLVFSTTNGTRAVEAAAASTELVLASLLNRRAIAEWVLTSPHAKVWIVCAGTDRQIACEDVLTAGAILEHCLNLSVERKLDCQLANDSSLLALHLFRSANQSAASPDIRSLFSKAAGGQNLISAGYTADVAEVSHLDAIGDIVPIRKKGESFPYFSLANPANS